MTDRVQKAFQTIELLNMDPESRELIELYGLEEAFPEAAHELIAALDEEFLTQTGIYDMADEYYWPNDELENQ